MSTPEIKKIGRGLAERERQKIGNTIPLARLVGAPTSGADLTALAVKAVKARNDLREFRDAIDADMEKYKVEAKARFDAMGKSQSENGTITDSFGADQRRRLYQDDVTKHRKMALATNEENRISLLKELREYRDAANAVKAGYASPEALLMAQTRADPKRATLTATLSTAGPREIENALRDAVLTKDRALMAAALSRYEQFDRSTRDMIGFSKRECAEALVGNEWQNINASIHLAIFCEESGRIANNQANGKNVANDKIEMGRRKADVESMLGRELEPKEDVDDTGKPKNKPGETWEQYLDRVAPGVKGSGKDPNIIGNKPNETEQERLERLNKEFPPVVIYDDGE